MVRPVPVVRRQSDPLIVQKLWEAISSVRAQKQVANMERLTRYVAREYQLEPEEIERQLNLAVADQLISLYKAVAVKGTNPGNEQDGYRVQPPEESERMGDHDWYCYDCHRPGPVLECSECWRVFHQTCTDEDVDADCEDTFVCAVCKDVRKQSRVKRKELNRLLGFTVQHLKERLRDLPWFHGQDTGVERFVYHFVDFATMEAKTESRKYKYLEQFYADARTILHNVFVCFGDSGIVPDLARLMIRDCRYDLDEIRQCKDCYYHSNMRLKDWFCQPCRPPHELVYAKQKGFSYWPAKVIKVTQEGYDVRFFGGLHQRALIPATSIKPLDASPKTLALKRTVGFVKASKELNRHQDLLKNATNLQQDEDNQSGIDNDLDDEQDKNDSKVTAVKRSKSHHKKLNKRLRLTDDSSSRVSIASSARSVENRTHKNSFEDSYMVTSSEDRVRELSSASTPEGAFTMSRKLCVTNARRPHKSTQTDPAVDESSVNTCLDSDNVMTRCSCDAKKTFDSLKTQLDNDYQKEKNKALKALEERLLRDFEEDKQRAVSRAVAQAQRDIEAVRKQTEEKCKSDFSDELMKVNHKHKAEISSAKKKQWCYNCEEEAMYHCCWNTSYCSIKCQQDHWHIEHKRMCRRKRN